VILVTVGALVFFGAMHLSGALLVEHLVTPVLLVRQQVTKPGFPQVERDAHFLTNRSHRHRSSS